MVSKTGSKDVAWQQLVEDVMPSMGRTPELEWRQKDEDSTDRVVVNLPRSVVDLVDLYVGRRGMRDMTVQAILDYLNMFTNQISTNEEGKPILASSPTGTARSTSLAPSPPPHRRMAPPPIRRPAAPAVLHS